MPNMTSIVLTDNLTATVTFEPINNKNGVAVWQDMSGGQSDIAPYASQVHSRGPKYQKTSCVLNVPKVVTSSDTGLSSKSADARADCDFKFAMDSTETERAYQYDLFVALLQDPDYREAVIKRTNWY